MAVAAEAGVTRFVVPAVDAESSTVAMELAAMFPAVSGAVGIHPCSAREYAAAARAEIKRLLNASPKPVAIGEVGLDYYHFEDLDEDQIKSYKERQESVFREMISLAKDHGLPLIIHSREAFKETLKILQEEAKGVPMVIHCFTGTKEEAAAWLAAGCLISFTGIITYKRNQELREVVASVPLERMMTETDAPYLAPEGFRGKLGEPRFVAQVAQCIADVKGLSLEEVDRITTATATQFFSL